MIRRAKPFGSLLLACLAATATGCGGNSAADNGEHSLAMVFRMHPSALYDPNWPCTDMHGTSGKVLVLNEASTIVASVAVTVGGQGWERVDNACQLTVRTSVPTNTKQFQFDVSAISTRRQPVVSRAEVVGAGWKVVLDESG